MRYVDIEGFQPPGDWEMRAGEALDELRGEIVKAESAALAAGENPAAARRAAITAGLEVNARKKLWRELSPFLAELKRGQCWYSESANPTSDKNIDHFRPKNGVQEDSAHEGYWWLAFKWQNFRFSSQWCNQRRVEISNGTEGGKGMHFPLCYGSFRARQEGDDIELEEPDLLDPTDPEDWKLLTFRPDGHPTPARQPGTREYDRAQTSIHIYHLHCRELVNERRVVVGAIQRIIQDLERLRGRITDDPKLRALYKSRQKELLRAIDPKAEYSAAALAYAKAEVYIYESGRQVKRGWLEEMLGS